MAVFDESVFIDETTIVRVENDFLQVDVAPSVGGRIVNLLEKPSHPCVLQSTGRRATLTVGQPWGDRKPASRIVFIGSHGGVDGKWLEKQLTDRSESLT